MNWGEATEATGGALMRGDAAAAFTSLSTDTRRIRPEEAFWALKGPRFDAHDFLSEKPAAACAGWVVREGAPLPDIMPANVLRVADPLKALAELAAHHRRRFEIPVAGITGSNGKTTVKEMLRAMLTRRGAVCANSGNFNNEIGLPLSVLELSAKHRYGVFEMGASHPGDIRYLTGIARPTVGVLTNIGPAHLEFFGDMQGVFRTKSELLEGLAPDAPVAVNLDDPWLAKLLGRLGRRAVTFGTAAKADVRLREKPKPGAIELEVRGRPVEVPGPGYGAIHRLNAAAAAAAAVALGLEADEIKEGLRAFKPAPLRFVTRKHASGAVFIVDTYNANPASMRAGVETFLETTRSGLRLLVLGEMKELGPEAPALHREIGVWAGGLPVDGVFLIGDEMRRAAEALKTSGARFPVVHAGEAGELASGLRPLLRKGTSVYFKASRAVAMESMVEGL